MTKATLDKFATVHPDARIPLEIWRKTVKPLNWHSPVEVRDTFRNADVVGDFLVFNICHNKYRLVVRAAYGHDKLFVYRVLTHVEYEGLDLKSIDLEMKKRDR